MLLRPAFLFVLIALISFPTVSYSGVVTLGNGGSTSVTNTLTTSLWIRFTTVANVVNSYNLSEIKLRGSGTDTGVAYKLYDSSGTTLVNNISGSGTMSNGVLSLQGENSFGGGGSASTYVLQITGLASSTYTRSNAGTSSDASYLPSSDTGLLMNAYEQTSLSNSGRVGGGSSFAVTLTVSTAVPEPSTFILISITLLMAVGIVFAKSYSKRQPFEKTI